MCKEGFDEAEQHTAEICSGAETLTTHGNAFEVNAFLPGLAAAIAFSQESSGDLRMDVLGATPGTRFDRLVVAGPVEVHGTLILNHGLSSPAHLVPHEVVHGGSVLGDFSSILGIVLSPTKYLAVTYDADSVLVTAALPGDANLDGNVDFDDRLTLAQDYSQPSRSWASGDFTGNGGADTINASSVNLPAYISYKIDAGSGDDEINILGTGLGRVSA